MIDGWHGYGDCGACGARPDQPCIALYNHGSIRAGITPLSTPHGGRPHRSDATPGQYVRLTRTAPATPAPGPVWSNGRADDLEHAAAYSSAQVETARRILARLREEMGSRWQLGLLSYVTQGVATQGLSPHQLAMMAVIDEEWTSVQ